MEDDILDLPQQRKRLRYAGFWIRLAAAAVDAVILAGAGFMVASVLFYDYSFFEASLKAQVLYVLIGMGYFAGMESSGAQGTLGKMAVGIKVGTIEGNPIQFSTALARYVAKFLSALLFFIGFMMAGWDVRHQALHDKLAGSYVYHA